MKKFKQYSNIALFSTLFMMTFIMGGCGGSSSCEDTTRPAVVVLGAPIITSTIPADGAVNVPLNTVISATFSEEINPDTVIMDTTFTVVDANGDPVPGMVSYGNNNTIMYFTPEISLDYNTTYTATITTDVTDMDGNALDIDNNLNVWSFTTINDPAIIPPAVNTPPYVISTFPEDNATNVPLNRTVSALISEELDDNTTGQNTFRLYDMTDPLNPVEVIGAVDYNNSIMTFDPDQNLSADTNYTARISASIADLEGATMGQAYEWNFATGLTVAAGPDPVNLGTAGDFAILAKSGITTTGTTLITGDIGVSPIGDTAITGFSLIRDSTNTFSTSIYVVGKVYAANMADPTPAKMTTAVSNMETAYTNAAKARPNTISLGSASTGTPYVAGVYKTDTAFLIAGDMTIDGGPDDVWIFQISGDLTVSPGVSILLTGGAQAKNIFWQVAADPGVILDAGSHFEGIVLSAKTIKLIDGATVNGRLLSQTNVTLIGNTVTQP